MFLELDGQRLQVLSFGAGARTLLAVGGWAGSWELWQQPIELLTANGWRCVAFDHRGAGESPAEPSSITVDALVADVAAVQDALDLGPCVLAGESMGGAVALLAAEREPARFTGLALAAPATPTLGEGGRRLAAGARADYPATVHAFVEASVPEPGLEHVKRWGRNVLLRAEPEQAARLLEAWAGGPYGDPSRVSTPTVIVHGTADAIVPIGYSRELAQTLPDVELVELEGVGHVPTMTRPDAVVAAIERRFG